MSNPPRKVINLGNPRETVMNFGTRRNPDDWHPTANEAKASDIPPRPPFAIWLADPHAKAQVLANDVELAEWMDDTLGDDFIAPLFQELTERSTSTSHAIFAGKHPTSKPDDAPMIAQTEDLGNGLFVTPVWFATSKRAIKSDVLDYHDLLDPNEE